MLHIRQPLSPFWALKQLSFRVVLTICTVLFLLGGLGGLRAEGIITPQLARKNKSRLCSNCKYGNSGFTPVRLTMIQNRRQSSFLVPDEDSLEDKLSQGRILFDPSAFDAVVFRDNLFPTDDDATASGGKVEKTTRITSHSLFTVLFQRWRPTIKSRTSGLQTVFSLAAGTQRQCESRIAYCVEALSRWTSRATQWRLFPFRNTMSVSQRNELDHQRACLTHEKIS